MKHIHILAVALFAAIGLAPAPAQGVDAPGAPKLADVLRYKPGNVLIYKPIRMPANASLNFTHIQLADGSVRPNAQAAVMLIVYASKPDQNGDHAVLFQDFHVLEKGNDPLLNFASFVPSRDAANFVDNDNRAGIIAILIGLLKTPNRADWMQAPLPPLDTVSGFLAPGDTSAGLLLPAVQKVREAAARR